MAWFTMPFHLAFDKYVLRAERGCLPVQGPPFVDLPPRHCLPVLPHREDERGHPGNPQTQHKDHSQGPCPPHSPAPNPTALNPVCSTLPSSRRPRPPPPPSPLPTLSNRLPNRSPLCQRSVQNSPPLHPPAPGNLSSSRTADNGR